MIPRLIHQIWLGSEIPAKFMSVMADWQLMNPGWKYQLWTQPLPDMYNEQLYDSANAYVRPDAVWQMRSDLLRYEILYRYGGFYCDVDTRPLRPLGDLFDGLTEFAVREDAKHVGNTYLASVPEHDVMLDLLQFQPSHALGFMDAAAGVVTGPQYMTPYWTKWDCHVDNRTDLWFPYSWSDVRLRKDKHIAIPEDAYAEHMWQHSRDKLQAAGKRYKAEAARKARGL